MSRSATSSVNAAIRRVRSSSSLSVARAADARAIVTAHPSIGEPIQLRANVASVPQTCCGRRLATPRTPSWGPCWRQPGSIPTWPRPNSWLRWRSRYWRARVEPRRIGEMVPAPPSAIAAAKNQWSIPGTSRGRANESPRAFRARVRSSGDDLSAPAGAGRNSQVAPATILRVSAGRRGPEIRDVRHALAGRYPIPGARP